MSRCITFFQRTRYSHFNKCTFSNVYICIQTIVPTLATGIGIIILAHSLIRLIHTFLINITERYEVTCRATTTTHIQISTISHGSILHQHIHPVHIRIQILIKPQSQDFHFIILIHSLLITCNPRFIHQHSITIAVCKFRCDGARIIRTFHLSIDFDLAFLTTFSSNQNHTICTARTVNCCGRSIFQYSKRLNIFNVNFIQITFKTINQHQCSTIGTKSGNTSNPEFRSVHTRLSGSLHSKHTRHISCQCVRKIGCRVRFQNLDIYIRHGTSHGQLFLCTSSRDYNLIDFLSFRFFH